MLVEETGDLETKGTHSGQVTQENTPVGVLQGVDSSVRSVMGITVGGEVLLTHPNSY